jgi:hypothetical protein
MENRHESVLDGYLFLPLGPAYSQTLDGAHGGRGAPRFPRFKDWSPHLPAV